MERIGGRGRIEIDASIRTLHIVFLSLHMEWKYYILLIETNVVA